MSKCKGLGKFALGAAIGAGVGILFAPKKGSETRRDLKKKFDELIAKAKELDANEVKEMIEAKIEEIKYEIEDLDKEKAIKIAKEKASKIKKKSEELKTSPRKSFQSAGKCSAKRSLLTVNPMARRYLMAKTAVVLVLPSRKGWICQTPEMNLAKCRIISTGGMSR